VIAETNGNLPAVHLRPRGLGSEAGDPGSWLCVSLLVIWAGMLDIAIA
jgi:hypothetical protein